MYPEQEPGVQKWKSWSRRRSTPGSANEDDNMRQLKSIPIRRKRVVRFDLSPSTIITIVLIVVGSWAMTRLLPAVLVLVGALVIVGTLSPAVQWLEAHRLRRGLGISIVIIVLLVITLLVVTLTFPELLAQVTSLLEKEPALRARVVASLAGSRLTAPLAETVRIMNYDALMKSFGATALALSRRVLESLCVQPGLHLPGALYDDRPGPLAWRTLRDRTPLATHPPFPRHDEPGDDRRGIYSRTAHNVRAHDCLHVYSSGGVRRAARVAESPCSAALRTCCRSISESFSRRAPAVAAALDRGPTVAVIVFVLMLAYEEFAKSRARA